MFIENLYFLSGHEQRKLVQLFRTICCYNYPLLWAYNYCQHYANNIIIYCYSIYCVTQKIVVSPIRCQSWFHASQVSFPYCLPIRTLITNLWLLILLKYSEKMLWMTSELEKHGFWLQLMLLLVAWISKVLTVWLIMTSQILLLHISTGLVCLSTIPWSPLNVGIGERRLNKISCVTKFNEPT